MKNLFLTLALLIFAVPAQASMDHHGHHDDPDNNDHNDNHMEAQDFMHHQNEAGTLTDSDQAYIHINHTMHEAMAIDFTGDPDIDFLKGMIPHHQGAVDMAHVQLDYGQDGLLKSFTQKVIRDQEREIMFMKRHLAALENENHHHVPSRSTVAFKRVNRAMHHHMNVDLSGNADVDFVAGMIPHHQGAVDMAKVVLAYGDDPFARRLAYDIINAQESEMTWMRNWLSRTRLMELF